MLLTLAGQLSTLAWTFEGHAPPLDPRSLSENFVLAVRLAAVICRVREAPTGGLEMYFAFDTSYSIHGVVRSDFHHLSSLSNNFFVI